MSGYSGPERRSAPLLDVPPTPDIAALEAAAESLTRLGDLRNAIAVWAIILRMRTEANVRNWTVRVYDADDDTTMIAEWHIENRTEDEASQEAAADVANEYPSAGDWTLTSAP